MNLVDTHCHLDDRQFDPDRVETIERAREAGVSLILAVGTGHGPPDLEAGIRLAEQHEFIYATVGIHPHDASKAAESDWNRLEELLSHPKVVALGEIGLDYHYDFSPRECQREVFTTQLRLARTHGKPIIIHTREAWSDMLDLLGEHWGSDGPGGIFHCFTGGRGEAVEVVQRGFHVSFAGILTYPKAENVREAAAVVPLDRLLIETDAPYLAPMPHRGKRNEPAFLTHTLNRLSEIRQMPAPGLAARIMANFRALCLPAGHGNGYTGKS